MNFKLSSWLCFIVVVGLLGSVNLFSQQNMRDVIHLKNGSIIRGIVVEHIPNVTYRIETSDGNILVYSADEVERITKERADNVPNRRDVVHLKNGSVIRGNIIEHIPNVSYRIEAGDGSIFVYTAAEVERITKEAAGTGRQRGTFGGATGSTVAPKRGDMTIGLGLLYWGGSADNDANMGFRSSFSYVLSEDFRLESAFSYLTDTETIQGIRFTEAWSDVSLNLHYLFPLENGAILYALAGFGVSAVTFSMTGFDSVSGSDFCFNFGGGINWILSDKWFLNSELSFKKVVDVDGLIMPFTVGVSYRF